MNIVILAGSNKKASTSTMLCKYIERQLSEQGHSVLLFDLNKRPLPLFTPDNRNPPDEHLIALKGAMLAADAVVLSSPEYHGSLSGVLKNALDHLGFDHFDGRTVLSVCSTGGAVGISTLQQMQTIVRVLHGINCPEWISIGGDNRAFTESGELANPAILERVNRAVRYFLKMAQSFDRH